MTSTSRAFATVEYVRPCTQSYSNWLLPNHRCHRLIKKLRATPRGDSISSYCNLSLHKMGVKSDPSSSPRLSRGLSTNSRKKRLRGKPTRSLRLKRVRKPCMLKHSRAIQRRVRLTTSVRRLMDSRLLSRTPRLTALLPDKTFCKTHGRE